MNNDYTIPPHTSKYIYICCTINFLENYPKGWVRKNNDYEDSLFQRTILLLNMFFILFINKLRLSMMWDPYMMISTG